MYDAFVECPDLTDVYCYAETVPTTDRFAFNEYGVVSATLHVPESAIESYKNTEPWSGFQNIVAIEPIKGDANSDYNVDSDDITELANAIVGKASDKYKIETADIDNDGIVNAVDLTKLIEILLKR